LHRGSGLTVSNLGRVDTPLKGKHFGSPGTGEEWQFRFAYSLNGKRRKIRINRLVLEAFRPNPDPTRYDLVDHIEGRENRLSNLRWSNRSLAALRRRKMNVRERNRRHMRWEASITVYGTPYDLGGWSTREDAENAIKACRETLLELEAIKGA
jgi:hypothetical protein